MAKGQRLRITIDTSAGGGTRFAAILFVGLCNAFGGPTAATNGYLRFLLYNFGCAPPLAVVIFHVSRYQSLLSGFLSRRSMGQLGDTGYSIYAFHTWSFRIFIRPPEEFSILLGVEAFLRILFAIGLTLIFARATYSLIEVPWRARIRALFGDRTRVEYPEHVTKGAARKVGLAAAIALLVAVLLVYQFWILPALLGSGPG